MRSNRSRFALLGVLALALSVTVGLTAGTVAAKKSKVKTFEETATVGAFVPDDVAVGASTPLISTIEVPKKYRKRKVADVNVTGLTTLGNQADAADDLVARLTAPSGRTVLLFDNVGDANLGPWTMDDDTPVSICDSAAPPCSDPNRSLPRPFAGTANLLYNDDSNDSLAGPLSNFDGTRMRGTWTLTVADTTDIGQISILSQWGLEIKPLKLKPPTVEVD